MRRGAEWDAGGRRHAVQQERRACKRESGVALLRELW